MAGFKQAIIDLEPKLFLTFDGDDFDPLTHDLLGLPQQIIDESGEGNNALFHSDNGMYLGHRMGTASLTELEQSDQYSMSFAFYGAQPLYPTVWAKTYLEVPHTTSFAFPNLGSFSVSLLLWKASDEAAFRSYTNSTANLTRPLISKGAIFKMDYIDNWASTDQLRVTHPGGVMNYLISTPAQFYADQKHIVFTWEVVPDPAATYRGTAKLYINGQLVMSQTYLYSDTYPNTNVASAWFIGGNTDSPTAAFNDRNTSDTRLDQIAVFETALTNDQVCWLFKKTRTYERVVQAAWPANYWTMDDAESSTDTTMNAVVGAYNGQYLGGVSKVLRRQSGPGNIPGSISTYFQNGGCANVHRTSFQYTPLFNPTTDYTVDFWFTCFSADRGVLLSIQGDDSPFNGMLVQINRRNDNFWNGGIQFNVSENVFLNSRSVQDNGSTPFMFNDGKWHYCALVRRGSVIELWLDGILHDSLNTPNVQIPTLGPGQLYLMSMMPGKLSVNGNMAHVSLLARALQAPEIRMRNNYAILYRIQGTVTLQGVPYRADIRAYRHLNGDLMQAIQSDPNDGTYRLHLVDNSLIDLMILNTQDTNVRYRAYGPILPSTYEDLPTS